MLIVRTRIYRKPVYQGIRGGFHAIDTMFLYGVGNTALVHTFRFYDRYDSSEWMAL